MTNYYYADKDVDELEIWPRVAKANTAHVTVRGYGVYVPAAEAPKAAQAILDVAGVKGAVIGTDDLPEVTGNKHRLESGTAAHIVGSFPDIDTRIRQLLAIKLHMEADAKAEATELKALEELKAKIEAEKAHDDLRTSPIALKALEIYNRACIGCGPYESWDATLDGDGVGDDTIRHFIGLAEAEEVKEKEAAEKLAARRDELVQDHVGNPFRYLTARPSVRSLVDRIIELEDAK